jgi:hypothetical protein
LHHKIDDVIANWMMEKQPKVVIHLKTEGDPNNNSQTGFDNRLRRAGRLLQECVMASQTETGFRGPKERTPDARASIRGA